MNDSTALHDPTEGAEVTMDRSEVEALLVRTATAAFTYYPGKEAEEPGYTIDEDVDWVMELARALDPSQVALWRRRIAEAIADPTGDRRGFITDLMALAEDE